MSNYRYHRYPQSSDSGKAGIVALVLAALVAVFLVVTLVRSYYGDDMHTACVINDKDRVHTDSGSEMRIYTDNCGVFVVQDSLLKTDYNSADRYSKIKVGQTYDIKSYGWRIGVFSAFPKIVEATPTR